MNMPRVRYPAFWKLSALMAGCAGWVLLMCAALQSYVRAVRRLEGTGRYPKGTAVRGEQQGGLQNLDVGDWFACQSETKSAIPREADSPPEEEERYATTFSTFHADERKSFGAVSGFGAVSWGWRVSWCSYLKVLLNQKNGHGGGNRIDQSNEASSK